MSDYRTFVIPYDFSEDARAALGAAADLARRLGADLHLVHVMQLPVYSYGLAGPGGSQVVPPVNMVELRAGVVKSLDEVAAGLDVPGKVELQVIEGVSVAGALEEYAEEVDADLIVMGTHGRTGMAHVFLGSVAERTLRNAPCPVLTVRAQEARDAK